MTRVTACAVPDTALLRRHADPPGCLADCFQATLHRPVGLSDLIRAFNGSRAFALESLILKGGDRACHRTRCRAGACRRAV